MKPLIIYRPEWNPTRRFDVHNPWYVIDPRCRQRGVTSVYAKQSRHHDDCQCLRRPSLRLAFAYAGRLARWVNP